jgi:hypothetical protein
LSKTIQLDSPKLLEPLNARVCGIRDSLVAAYKAGQGSPNEVIGNERELFLRKYLEAAYPKPFRFASGFVMDKHGNMSGQLDIIAEKLHSISFPATAASDERLYLAEMVSAVISVKSNLFAQWNQIGSEIDQLTPVQSQPSGTFQVNVRKGNIPFFVVAYSGGKDLKTLNEKLKALPVDNCFQALLVLDSNLFAVQTAPGEWATHNDESSFLYFVCELHHEITRNFAVGENIWEYACAVTTE